MEENEFKEKMQEKSKILGFDFSVEQISKFYKYMNIYKSQKHVMFYNAVAIYTDN